MLNIRTEFARKKNTNLCKMGEMGNMYMYIARITMISMTIKEKYNIKSGTLRYFACFYFLPKFESNLCCAVLDNNALTYRVTFANHPMLICFENVYALQNENEFYGNYFSNISTWFTENTVIDKFVWCMSQINSYTQINSNVLFFFNSIMQQRKVTNNGAYNILSINQLNIIWMSSHLF